MRLPLISSIWIPVTPNDRNLPPSSGAGCSVPAWSNQRLWLWVSGHPVRIGVIGMLLVAAFSVFLALGGATALLTNHDEGEPFSLTDGVSIWPGEIIRLFVVVLCIVFLAKGSRDVTKNGEQITDDFLFQDESASQPLSLRSFWINLKRVYHPVATMAATTVDQGWSWYREASKTAQWMVRTIALFVFYMATNDKQVIFSLVNVGKVYPPKKQVLREIYLGFYYGAKIGVLGLNGSGKSSLLKIIAGVDENFTGEISRSKGYSVGLLEQEPQLDQNKTVKEVVEEGKKELVALLKDYEAVSNRIGESSPDEMEKLLDKQAQLQEKIEAANGWELENHLDIAMLQLPVLEKVETGVVDVP